MEADAGSCWILHPSKSAYAALRNRKSPEKILFGKVDLMAPSGFLGSKVRARMEEAVSWIALDNENLELLASAATSS